MGNLNVVVIAVNDYSKVFGKKGTASDITLYDLKRGQDTVSLIEPTKYPERLAPLFYAASMAESALIVVDEINAQLGESMLMLHCLDIRQGWIVLRNYLTADRVLPLLKGTSMEGFHIIEEDHVQIREMLLEVAEGKRVGEEGGPVSVPIDHHFNVKGVGTVVLGHVVAGTLHKHDELLALPTTRKVLVRSIQKHDDDYEMAYHGDRVGLALKNIEAEELDRGFVLSNDPQVKGFSSLHLQAKLVKYWPTPLKPGMVIHVGHWMQFQPARLESVDDGGDWRNPIIKLVLERDMVLGPSSRLVLTYLEGGKLRIVGTGRQMV